jgi:hypothetical protein
MCLSLKKAPSQVAHAETPRPFSRSSESSPSQRAVAPVAMITAFARYSSFSTQTRNGCSEKSTFVTSSVTNSAPKCSACARKSSIIFGPITPSG